VNHVQEIAMRVAEEMNRGMFDFDPGAGRRYQRIALIDYSSFLRKSSFRTTEQNRRAFADVQDYAEKAISLGVPREKMDESFFRLRKFYVPRLKPTEVNL